MKDLNKAISILARNVQRKNFALFQEPHSGDAGARLARLCISQCMGKGILFLEAPSSLHQNGTLMDSENVAKAVKTWESNTLNGVQTLTSIANVAVGKGWKIRCIDSRTESRSVTFHSKGGQAGRARQEWMAYHIYEALNNNPQLGALLPVGLKHITGSNYGEGYLSLGQMLTGSIAPIRNSTEIMGTKLRYRILKRMDITQRPQSLTYAT